MEVLGQPMVKRMNKKVDLHWHGLSQGQRYFGDQ